MNARAAWYRPSGWLFGWVVVCAVACGGKAQGPAPNDAATAADVDAHGPADSGALEVGSMPGTDATVPPGDSGNAQDAAFEPGVDATVSVPDGGMLLGTFAGYVQGYTFPSGSNAVLMRLALGPDGKTVSGIVVLGNANALPAPTDPNVGYPPGYEGLPAFFDLIVEGFAFTVLPGGTLEGALLQVEVNAFEPWGPWCELQAPYNTMGTFGCAPPGACSSMPPSNCTVTPLDGGARAPVDCGRQSLCGGCPGQSVCVCTAAGCSVPIQGSGQIIDFQLSLASTALTGSANGLPMAQGSIVVQLAKQ